MTAAAQPHHALLPPGHIHLWMLPDRKADVERMRTDGVNVLSPDERQRHHAMKHPRAADRFVLGRVFLRSVLARYLDLDPAHIAFRYNANGKPGLADPSGPGISFNLSDSASEIVVAVSRARAIGVDLEPAARAGTAYRIARQFFSAVEIQQLETLGTKAAAHALMLWTLKESIVKAKGDTVWDGLAEVSLATEGRRIIWPSDGDAEPPEWRLAAGAFGENHVLALAVGLSAEQADAPPVFRTYRLGSDAEEPNGFEPAFST